MSEHDLLPLLGVFCFTGVAWLWSRWDFVRQPRRRSPVPLYSLAHPREGEPPGEIWDLQALSEAYGAERAPQDTRAGQESI